MDDTLKNEQKVMVRISFLTQHIIDKFKQFPCEIEQGDDSCFVAKYFNKSTNRQVIILVRDDLSCYVSVVNRLNDTKFLGKEFKEYNCLDEAFNLLRIPTPTTTTNERNIDEIQDEASICNTDEQQKLP